MHDWRSEEYETVTVLESMADDPQGLEIMSFMQRGCTNSEQKLQ
jgi:hypothetical protein